MTNQNNDTTVLVTGASGFIAMHCILRLLQDGYRVRGTLRNPRRETGLRKTFHKHIETGDRLEFIIADLLKDNRWDEAVKGCDYVMHIASPVPVSQTQDENELINPAREGTLRVMKASAAAGVKRVVLTSSIAAVVYGHPRDGSVVFDESFWSKTDKDIGAYPKSKTLAEQAAWDFVNNLSENKKMELSVINPGVVLGPVLDNDWGASGEIVRTYMKGGAPGCPKIGFAPVDVRDVADAHLSAMIQPEAAGKRFICALEFVWVKEVANILHKHYSGKGYKIHTISLPSLLVRLLGLFSKKIRYVAKGIGRRSDMSSERIKTILNWKPRGLEEMVVSMAESFIQHGVV